MQRFEPLCAYLLKLGKDLVRILRFIGMDEFMPYMSFNPVAILTQYFPTFMTIAMHLALTDYTQGLD